MKQIRGFEIVGHGIQHAQYFQGRIIRKKSGYCCGADGTIFDECFTGIGKNAREAYDDAVKAVAMSGYITEILPINPHGISSGDKIPVNPKDDEIYCYVSIRIK